jgi:hypothetical protein
MYNTKRLLMGYSECAWDKIDGTEDSFCKEAGHVFDQFCK